MGRIRSMMAGAGGLGGALGGMSTGAKIGTGVGVAGLLGLMGTLKDAITGQKEKNREEAQRQLEDIAHRRIAHEQELQRRRIAVETNLRSLAATAPDIYNRVAAGRQLPQGAVVIGGAARRDLLEELALRMGDGDYSQGQGPPMGQMGQ